MRGKGKKKREREGKDIGVWYGDERKGEDGKY
jgi:hypothetical protein